MGIFIRFQQLYRQYQAGNMVNKASSASATTAMHRISKSSRNIRKVKEETQVNQLLLDLKSIIPSSKEEQTSELGVIENAISYIQDLRSLLSRKDLTVIDEMFTPAMQWCLKCT